MDLVDFEAGVGARQPVAEIGIVRGGVLQRAHAAADVACGSLQVAAGPEDGAHLLFLGFIESKGSSAIGHGRFSVIHVVIEPRA